MTEGEAAGRMSGNSRGCERIAGPQTRCFDEAKVVDRLLWRLALVRARGKRG